MKKSYRKKMKQKKNSKKTILRKNKKSDGTKKIQYIYIYIYFITKKHKLVTLGL